MSVVVVVFNFSIGALFSRQELSASAIQSSRPVRALSAFSSLTEAPLTRSSPCRSEDKLERCSRDGVSQGSGPKE